MKRRISTAVIALLSACLPMSIHAADVFIEIGNNSDLQRHEVVEIDLDSLKAHADAIDSENMIIRNSLGQELPHQVTHDGKLLLEVSIHPHATATYRVEKGMPKPMQNYVCGNVYPYRKDDLAWENDKSAYRVYGPALQRTGEKSFGIDVWVKNVPYPVVQHRYELGYQGKCDADSVARLGQKEKADSIIRETSFHLDHGTGMDAYSVGATLGCGTPALMTGDEIIFPYCYTSYRIIENGPLSFVVELEYDSKTGGIKEYRTISLDKGSHFNKMTVRYENIKRPMAFVSGIVLHQTEELKIGNDYVCYADPTDNPALHNSQIYVAALFPQNVDTTFITRDKTHALGKINLYRGEAYSYYFGSAWSNYDINTFSQWVQEIENFLYSKRNPLKVTIR